MLQHQSADGPAFLARWLADEGLAADVRNTEAGDVYPPSVARHAALAILGGEMGANDPLPSLRQAEALIREAVALGVPVLGHCLGGQLMARALGARVGPSPAPEIGWQPLQVDATPQALAWFGAAGPRHVFQWHHDAFELPPGAERLAGSAACPNQAFALGPHLAMQFHVEVDAEKLERWSRDADRRDGAVPGVPGIPTVQSGEAMRADAALHLAAQQALARRLYARWWRAAAVRDAGFP